MTLENELINKSYYQHVIEGDKKGHPIQILGEMYMDEKKEELPDFSAIRFSQGEVYFLNKDYEAAIFKWENVENELKPWALKNIADAHYEMDLLAIAEDYYRSVNTESVVLQTEVLLQLFSLNKNLSKREKAVDLIKNAVNLNPDYSGVTDIARTFFEENQDWDNAVELAVKEAIRTESLSWFKVLEEYVERRITVNIEPNYFKEALKTLFNLDQFRFESLAALLWNSYRQTNLFFSWLKEINNLLLGIDLETSYIWKKLPDLYKETYFELISGKFLIRNFSDLIHHHLTNWIKVSSASNSLISSSAVLAWREYFPSSLDSALVSKAEHLLNMSSHYQIGMEDALRLYESIKNWAEKEGLLAGEHFDSLIRDLKMEEHTLEELRTSKIMSIIRKVIKFLIEKRAETENALLDKIQWNEELLAKLNGIHHQLSDIEEEKAQAIKKSFGDFKDDFRQALLTKIPELLRNCSNLVKEDSDYGKIHIEINEEMNRRITHYMEGTAKQHFQDAIQGWIRDCEDDLKKSQAFLDEMSDSINNLYAEDKIALDCDFKVLDDWRRDVNRITRGMVHLEKANIIMRSTPSQLVLKSVGKLLGPLAKNKEKLQNLYKNFIESTDYNQTVQSIINPFIQQLELFENSIARDMNMFFTTPFEALNRAITEADEHINRNKEDLNKIRNNPENYRDPITLFELKLRQYEIMNSAGESISKKN
ncbi:hypothetical protein SAMN05877753_10484 [Bacillus oleivorans]|uniref:Uncharacterized protein n=1 Tax=Bacillus oleivorans TaxID=1448271 RepID=A0A285CTI5_9BACI|nr:hypothetical protein [Bacillus oleivorans]SNX70368.1 hypothetical protein SAMN05877753_10484 [Bacillus oleivorans]